MAASTQSPLSHTIEDLKEEREDLSLQIYLGKRTAKNQLRLLGRKLEELDQHYEAFCGVSQEKSDQVRNAIQSLVDEIRSGFGQIRKSIS